MWIAKYELDIETPPQRIRMARGKVLHVGTQEDRLFMWALNDDTLCDRTFRIIGTGPTFEVPYNGQHVGSVQLGSFMWHVFEVTR